MDGWMDPRMHESTNQSCASRWFVVVLDCVDRIDLSRADVEN